MAAYTYEFSSGICGHKVSAQDVGEVCEELERTVGLSPKALLDASRDVNAPLHNEFEWDDTAAAEKWRLEQARLLIAHVRIVQSNDKDEREKVRGFVSTPGRQGNYVSLNTAMHKEEYRSFLLEQARKDSEIYIAKYRKMQELASVISEMEKFLEVG